MDTHLLPGMDVETLKVTVSEAELPVGRPRLHRPDRAQSLMRPQQFEELVSADHSVRVVWAVVERCDLSAFYRAIRACGSNPGRSATDPKLLVALWVQAHIDNVGSAREVARRCEEHAAYQWLCGGVSINHHTLSDFRTGHEKALDGLLTKLLAMMADKKLIQTPRLAQDGMRVRASAGASGFRRRQRLQELLQKAKERVETLKQQLDGPVAAEQSAARRSAQERAARERQERIEKALAVLPELEAAKESLEKKVAAARKKEVRASTTDGEARVMKMPDGGFRPAFNVQLACDIESRAIVGVEMTNSGVDAGQAEPMRQQVEKRLGKKISEHLYDGGFVRLTDIESAAAAGVRVYAPPKPPRNKSGRASGVAPRRYDSPAVAQWRERMASEEGQAIYRLRASTSETINAELRTYRGLSRFLVRGLAKVRCVALWSALAYNVMHFGKVLIS